MCVFRENVCVHCLDHTSYREAVHQSIVDEQDARRLLAGVVGVADEAVDAVLQRGRWRVDTTAAAAGSAAGCRSHRGRGDRRVPIRDIKRNITTTITTTITTIAATAGRTGRAEGQQLARQLDAVYRAHSVPRAAAGQRVQVRRRQRRGGGDLLAREGNLK